MGSTFFNVLSEEKNTDIQKKIFIFHFRVKQVFAGVLGITTAYDKVFHCIICE